MKEIFELWIAKLGKDPQRTKLTPTRRAKIRARLKDSSIEEIKRAISGASKSEFHVENGHTDIELILRNRNKVEQFIEYDEKPTPPGKMTDEEWLKAPLPR